jgi:hypothetical protein
LKVSDDAQPGHPVEIVREATAAGGGVYLSWQEDDDRQCSNYTGVFHGLAYSIMHDHLSFRKCAHGGCPENWRIKKIEPNGEKILLLGTNHGCITTNPNWSMLHCSGNIPVHLQPKSLVTLSAGNVMLTMFWNSQGVLSAHFQKHCENVNPVSYCEVWLKLQDAICRKHPGQLARRVLTMPDPIQPEQPRREFKNYSGNFLNIHLTARLFLQNHISKLNLPILIFSCGHQSWYRH